jgi:hypothetical protein
MNILPLEHNKDGISIGKNDAISEYKSKWPIYRLHLFDKKGLWLRFKNKLNELNENKLLITINEKDIIDYYLNNLDVEFELHFFNDIMQKHNFFKYKDVLYSYSIGKKTKNTKKIAYVRFYFDLEKFLNC